MEEQKRGRPIKSAEVAPISPYYGNPERAIAKAFDRLTGELFSPEQLQTYAEVLAQYHLSCESKFENGQFLDRGRTERRHVTATEFIWIGKEANQVGKAGNFTQLFLRLSNSNQYRARAGQR